MSTIEKLFGEHAFVFLDLHARPHLITDNSGGWWLYSWNKRQHNFVSVRPVTDKEVCVFRLHAVPADKVARYVLLIEKHQPDAVRLTVEQRFKMLARKAKPPRKGGAFNLERREHEHSCYCGLVEGRHETGAPGCLRFMTEAPAVRPDDRWFVDGEEITDYTLRQQRGYRQHDCGCWSRQRGSDNSIEA